MTDSSYLARAERIALEHARSEQHGCVRVDRFPAKEGLPYDENEVGDILAIMELLSRVLSLTKRFTATLRSSSDSVLYAASAIVILLLAIYVATSFIVR